MASTITGMYLSGSLSAVISPPALKPIGQVSKPLFVAESMKTIAASEQERMISFRINASQIQRAVDEVADLDLLINNAGIGIFEDLTDLGVIQKQLDVNLLGPLKVTQAFLPSLIRSKGAIVNILSVVSIAPMPVLPGYSISKAGALSLTQSLRALLKRQEVGVHAVILGAGTFRARQFR